MKAANQRPLSIADLQQAYRAGLLDPVGLVEQILARLSSEDGAEAWICVRDREALLAEAALCAERLRDPLAASALPLLGIPFAVKDNIDVAGLATTAACPAFSRVATADATVVARLRAAGAIVIGKTNLDQFATGLVGTRSPYGEVRNPFNPDYMSGGSSSGSAAVVARGWVPFALGTDTAGSGRVPAGACNLVGIKPSVGLVSCAGVLPACRSLDCVSVMSHTVADGWAVLSLLAGEDAADPYCRPPLALGPLSRKWRLGIPRTPEFHGDALAERAWQEALAQVLATPGVEISELDFTPFHAVAALLYEGPWVAERRAAIGCFMDEQGEAMDATVRSIIARADAFSAVDGFNAQYRLAALRRECEAQMAGVDLLLVPTAPTLHTRAAIAAEPLRLNAQLGHYTNFVNLLGMAALALPGPFRADGLPAGITLIGAAGADHRLAELARRLEPALHRRLGLSELPSPACEQPLPPLPASEPMQTLAVVGAHLSGLPLNWQLVERGGRWLETTRTAACYRLYALPGTTPPKPGLVSSSDGHAIEVELWQLPLREFGSFVADIPAPLGIGRLRLIDGREVQGFLCEAAAVACAENVSADGGWRNHLARLASRSVPA